MTPISSPYQLVGTVFAALFGLAFGSFLNVCLARWPQEESIVSPASHCRRCSHTLAWWENLPLVSWLILRGRCRSCHAPIGVRYPLIELAIALLWTGCWLCFNTPLLTLNSTSQQVTLSLIQIIGFALLSWILVALAALDAEYLWLPDLLTLPGIAIGFVFSLLVFHFTPAATPQITSSRAALNSLLAILAGAGTILFIRLAYWLIRRKEGMGLGDAKLMAMLGAWLGLTGAIESFVLAILAAAFLSIAWFAVRLVRRNTESWAQTPLPFGTFLSLAALSEVFKPEWLWHWYAHTYLP